VHAFEHLGLEALHVHLHQSDGARRVPPWRAASARIQNRVKGANVRHARGSLHALAAVSHQSRGTRLQGWRGWAAARSETDAAI
jgi:hypothetical protein